LKELSDELAIEGFIVMASRDHLDPFYYQGGTILANQYLKMIVEEGDPMGGFHSFVAGIKKRCRVVDVDDKSVSEVARPKKIRRVNGLEEFLDVDKGDFLFFFVSSILEYEVDLLFTCIVFL
jgi:hypothetical protein